MRLGQSSFSGEWQTIARWPSCPMAKINSKKRVTLAFKYEGLARILKTAVNVSFTMTSGAGGFSISPKFTCIPTVDKCLDPAFRILRLISDCFVADHSNPEALMIAGMKRLIRLVDDGKPRPTAVTSTNKSLMHYAMSAVCFQIRLTVFPGLTSS